MPTSTGIFGVPFGFAPSLGLGLAGAVQEQDDRGRLVLLVVVRDEHDVLVLGAVGVLERLVDEAGVSGVRGHARRRSRAAYRRVRIMMKHRNKVRGCRRTDYQNGR